MGDKSTRRSSTACSIKISRAAVDVSTGSISSSGTRLSDEGRVSQDGSTDVTERRVKTSCSSPDVRSTKGVSAASGLEESRDGEPAELDG